MAGEGVRGRGCAWQGGMHGGEHAWWGVEHALQGGMSGRGECMAGVCVAGGAYMVGGVHDGGHAWACGMHAPPPYYEIRSMSG